MKGVLRRAKKLYQRDELKTITRWQAKISIYYIIKSRRKTEMIKE